MAVLKFVCPTSGNLVDTGLDMDARSFAGLPRERTELSCLTVLIPISSRLSKPGWGNSSLNTSDRLS